MGTRQVSFSLRTLLNLTSIKQPLCMYEMGDWMSCSSIRCFSPAETHFNHAHLSAAGPQIFHTDIHLLTHAHTLLLYLQDKLYKPHSAVSLQATKPKCGHVINAVKMETDELLKGTQTCKAGGDRKERERRKYLIISTLYGELRPCALRQSNYQDSAC